MYVSIRAKDLLLFVCRWKWYKFNKILHYYISRHFNFLQSFIYWNLKSRKNEKSPCVFLSMWLLSLRKVIFYEIPYHIITIWLFWETPHSAAINCFTRVWQLTEFFTINNHLSSKWSLNVQRHQVSCESKSMFL